ncbi:unnamed protein product [Gongylonema pulchrum]|uniref:Autophagy-related protein 9 n=1 Tax=Gongylonema pulchrum TaxID=637853 RepID=A0A183EYB8_9BILA|nr:unnamed protein product [Gongylonema pulchrum]
MLAFALLLCAWVIVFAFPCIRFTYYVPIWLRGNLQVMAETIPLSQTCGFRPRWWGEQQAFVEQILRHTRYYRLLSNAIQRIHQRFELFSDQETVDLIKPFNGQLLAFCVSKFVIFGCVILAFPILLLLMFMRCFSEQEDLMEEAMFDLVEISIFSVFAVVQVG